MNIIKLYQDHNIPYATDGPNCSPGWVVINCPHCDDPSMHLGYSLKEDFMRCWRCGWRPINKTIAKLLNTNEGSVIPIISRYGGKATPTKPVETAQTKPFQFPTGTGPLLANHIRYLERRGFDPEYLEATWDLRGTGPVGLLDGGDYKNRIVAPIRWGGKIVSFQSRIISSSSSKPRYKACPKDREVIHHQDILYGNPDAWTSTGICVEGITDVWRLGYRAFATFGTEIRDAQLIAIKENFKRVIVLFDPDRPGMESAERLTANLKTRGMDAEEIVIKRDPGSMKQDDADHLVRRLL